MTLQAQHLHRARSIPWKEEAFCIEGPHSNSKKPLPLHNSQMQTESRTSWTYSPWSPWWLSMRKDFYFKVFKFKLLFSLEYQAQVLCWHHSHTYTFIQATEYIYCSLYIHVFRADHLGLDNVPRMLSLETLSFSAISLPDKIFNFKKTQHHSIVFYSFWRESIFGWSQ